MANEQKLNIVYSIRNNVLFFLYERKLLFQYNDNATS
jgi:hypothetical protein